MQIHVRQEIVTRTGVKMHRVLDNHLVQTAHNMGLTLAAPTKLYACRRVGVPKTRNVDRVKWPSEDTLQIAATSVS